MHRRKAMNETNGLNASDAEGNFYISALLDDFVPSSASKNKEEERERFGKIISLVMQVPIGRQTLMAVERHKLSKFCFESMKSDLGYQEGDKIALNPSASNEALATVLVHEATHSLQSQWHNPSLVFDDYYTAESLFRYHRAQEADACAKQALFVQQCKNILPNVYKANKGLYTHGHLEKALDRGASVEEAMQEAFMGWYKNPSLVRAYDNIYAEWLEKSADYAGTRGHRFKFAKNVSNDDIMKFCSYRGRPYIDEYDAFSDPHVNGIELSTRNRVQGALNAYAKATKQNMDTSMYSMTAVSSYDQLLKNDAERRKKREERLERQATRHNLNDAFTRPGALSGHGGANVPPHKPLMQSIQEAGEKTVSETPKPRAALMERLNRLSSQQRRDADVTAVKTVQSGGKER